LRDYAEIDHFVLAPCYLLKARILWVAVIRRNDFPKAAEKAGMKFQIYFNNTTRRKTMKAWKKNLLAAGIVISLSIPAAAFACGCQGNQYRTGTGPVSMEEAQQITLNYLSTIDDGSLRPGNIELDGNVYLVDILDAEDAVIAKLNIDMFSGAVQTKF
jgi:hypothetical protein